MLSYSHISFVTFRALVRIRGRKFGIISNDERSKPMNNEPNKPIPAQELTEKELEGINGGMKLKPLGDRVLIEPN